MTNPLLAASQDLVGVVRKHASAVAAVHGRRFPSAGVVWRPGIVVTAEHTLRADEEVNVSLEGGKTVTAKVSGRDPGTDVAVLTLPSTDTPAIDRGGEHKLEAGALVISVGRSPNAGPVASMGIISAVSGPWRTWRGGRLENYVRLDVAMYPGSSGSVVADVSGNVLGIATSALSRVAGLVIPSAAIDRVVHQIVAEGGIKRGYLGVALQRVKSPEGLIVMTVEPESPAAQAGILVGDILIALDGTAAREVDDVQNALEAHPAGSTILATLVRGGQKQEVAIKIGERVLR